MIGILWQDRAGGVAKGRGTDRPSGDALGEFRGNPYKNFSIGNSPKLGG
jgi:hypothetical protein